MAVQAKRLNARSVETIKAPGRHADGGNLYLNISRSGGRSWVFLYKFGGRQREAGLGPVRDVSLSAARDVAAKFRQLIRDGVDPIQARRTAVTKPTFGSFADELVDTMRSAWRSPKHLSQWRLSLDRHAAPLRGIAVDQVSTEDVLAVLKPLWTIKPETASRLRGRIETVLHAATARNLRHGDNPAAWTGHLKALLPPARPKGTRGQYAAVPIDDVPQLVLELRGLGTISASALEFAILTAARSGEIFGATWPEFDLERRTWTIPAARMKAAIEHRVPLSDRAVEIALEMLRVRRSDFVFCGPRTGAMLANTALSETLKRLRSGVTPHGFRSTFRDWAAERTGFPSDVCEAALAHTIKNRTEAAYRRGDLFEKRRVLMAAWATFACSADLPKVVTLSLRR